MEETLAHVDAVNDAEPDNEDVAVNVGGHSDSTQSQAKGRKSYTVGKIPSFTTACRCTSRYNSTLVKFAL